MASKRQQKSIATTPVIRAKTSAPAFVSSGHVHDNLYIRYDDDQILSADEISQFLENIDSATNASPKLARGDIEQEMSDSAKNQFRENIGIVDDIDAVDSSGNIKTSAFGNKVAGSAPTDNELTNHFLRFDVSSVLNSANATRFAANGVLISGVSGVAPQTIQSQLTISGGDFIVSGGTTSLTNGLTQTGTMSGEGNTTTVEIANPDDGALTSIIKITAASGTTDSVTAIDLGLKRAINGATPTGDNDLSTKKYVDDQILALDFDGEYLRRDGNLAMSGDVNMGGFKITNTIAPTANSGVVNKGYSDASTEILTGVTDGTAGGFDETSESVAVTSTGKYLVMVSGKIVGSAGVFDVEIKQGATTLATRNINSDGDSQWSITVPVTVSSITDPISVDGDSELAFNQLDVIKVGH